MSGPARLLSTASPALTTTRDWSATDGFWHPICLHGGMQTPSWRVLRLYSEPAGAKRKQSEDKARLRDRVFVLASEQGIRREMLPINRTPTAEWREIERTLLIHLAVLTRAAVR